VRLFEYEDFEQAMLRAAAQFEVSEQFVEKDYYVTEILRIVAQQLGDKAVFKGGTSLSKGWGLITRFSEDIDLFVNPDRFEPRPGKNKLDRILKNLAVSVERHPALTWLREEGKRPAVAGARISSATKPTLPSYLESAPRCDWSPASRAAHFRPRPCRSRPWSANSWRSKGVMILPRPRT
jgi:Nucleotidyl transferase AbiEii toxin, Type IV TA system